MASRVTRGPHGGGGNDFTMVLQDRYRGGAMELDVSRPSQLGRPSPVRRSLQACPQLRVPSDGILVLASSHFLGPTDGLDRGTRGWQRTSNRLSRAALGSGQGDPRRRDKWIDNGGLTIHRSRRGVGCVDYAQRGNLQWKHSISREYVGFIPSVSRIEEDIDILPRRESGSLPMTSVRGKGAMLVVATATSSTVADSEKEVP
ncbi:hypothetical protein QJS10_CPB15g01723 [Acorus calamus]|uniref:Uncharacterized protein n=1 Tax=Acorus calamus TaxID=4465 RepID=A0AAV9D7Z5_ACOCL|nr:hypothetical protein QJS10_CPB15g01723 [Acorus calamus]